MSQKKIGIIGGGPAGLHCGYLLAKSGFAVTLYDHQIPFEKPCGGGITGKTFRDFPDLHDLQTHSKSIDTFRFHATSAPRGVEVAREQALSIISRKTLGALLLQKATHAGVVHRNVRVKGLSGKTIQSEIDEVQFDFVVGADGAQGVCRKALGAKPFSRWGAIGYYVEGLETERADVYFRPDQAGYLWVFPRAGHSSVGLAALKGCTNKRQAEAELEKYLAEFYPGQQLDPDKTYAATIPIPETFERNDLIGSDWALIGDAAGLADPITGEGIYYAFASAELLACALIEGNAQTYYDRLNDKILPELSKASRVFGRFYSPFVIENMLTLADRSPSIRRLMIDLILGQQGYLDLKKRLLKTLPMLACWELPSAFVRKKLGSTDSSKKALKVSEKR